MNTVCYVFFSNLCYADVYKISTHNILEKNADYVTYHSRLTEDIEYTWQDEEDFFDYRRVLELINVFSAGYLTKTVYDENGICVRGTEFHAYGEYASGAK